MRISDWRSDVCSSDLDRLAEWDPFTMPVITEKPGVVKYQDLIDGKTLVEQTDEATGIAQRVVSEYRGAARSKEDLRPRLTLLDTDRSEEHTSELQSLMRISYAVFCLKKKK